MCLPHACLVWRGRREWEGLITWDLQCLYITSISLASVCPLRWAGTFVPMLLSLWGIKQCRASSCPAIIWEDLFLDTVFGSIILGETSSRKVRALPGPKLWQGRQLLSGVSREVGKHLEAKEKHEPHWSMPLIFTAHFRTHSGLWQGRDLEASYFQSVQLPHL